MKQQSGTSAAAISPFSSHLLAWYSDNARKLPWRGKRTPYAIWVSEVMLQQTRVDSVIPYFRRWMKQFPTVEALAAVSEQEVLARWEGLGYYARARNLLKAARIVVRDFAGRLPSTTHALRALPGIGQYTAGAIASIAYGVDEPTLDGNIRRVLARVFNVRMAVDSSPGRKQLWRLAAKHLPKGRAGQYNQALMDLGATICLPTQPKCSICPAQHFCAARRLGIQERRPIGRSRHMTPHYSAAAVVVVRRDKVLLARRPSRGLLGGMWEFPNVRLGVGPHFNVASNGSWARALYQRYGIRVRRKEELGLIRHVYTHFRVTVQALGCELISRGVSRNLRWIPIAELPKYPMGKVDRQIARHLPL